MQNILKIIVCLLLVNCSLAQTNEIDILQNYIKLKSVSGNEKKAGSYLKSVATDLGFYITVFDDVDSSYNFCASILPLSLDKKAIILQNHIDVVPAENDSTWAFPPFDATIKNDTIYGRGVIDVKGLAIMQLFALDKLKQQADVSKLKNNFVVLCMSGEETGGINGAAKMIKDSVLKRLNPLVVFGEGGGGINNVLPGKPSTLCFFVSNAEKKSMWLRLDATVKSHGHGSVPSSKTANKLLLKAIQKIENSESRIYIDKSTEVTFHKIGNEIGGFKGFILSHLNWWIFKPIRKKALNDNLALKSLVTNSYQLTRIQNPKGAVNQVSQTATAYYDCRLLPNKNEKPLLMKLLFRIVDPRIKITVLDESAEAEPSELKTDYLNIEKAIKKNYPNAVVMPVLFPATTDNSYFRNAGINSYGFLPFCLNEEMMESVHSSNEKLPVSAITNGIKLYYDLMLQYALSN